MILRLIRGLWSLVWLLVLLVGLPAALVYYVGWPFPDHRPSPQEWQQWVHQPLTRPAVIGTVAVLIWLLWAFLLYAVVVEILTRARRMARWLRRLPLPPVPTPMQATASGVLGAAVLGMPTGTAHPQVHQVAAQPAAGSTLPAARPPPPAQIPPAGPPAGDRHDPAGQDPAGRGRGIGVVLPDGGWMTDQTAAAAVSAVTVVWVQRRRRYLPRPPAGAARDDADLAPLPATVAAIQDGLHRHQHPDDDDTDGPDQTGAATPPDPAALESATIGHRAGRALRPADLPAGGTGLTGEGAPAAARGIIAAVLLAGRSRRGHDYPGHDPQVAAIRVVTTASDLAILLGPTATDHHDDTPGLVVADTVDDAIGHLDEAVLHRSQALTAPPHDNAASSPETAGAAAPLVLVTSCPTDSAAARRLAAILRLSTPLGITGVLLGRWPHGPEWRVDPDGTSRPADKPSTVATRLSVLTAGATVDLLTLLREARPRGHRPPPAPPTTSAARQPSDDNPGRPDNPGSRATRRLETPPATVGHDVTPPAGPSPLRLTVLGPPALHHADDLAPVRLARTAALQVLVFLAVHPTGASTARLGAALWPRIRPDTAAGSVYTAVRSLRNALPAGVDVIVRDGERYRLDARHVDVDLWRLHEAVNNAATALDPHARRRALRAVVDGYTGELASDQPWPWLAAHREGVRRHVVDAQAALAAADPDPHAALAMLQDAIRIDPLNEELHRRAMRGYAAAGNPTAVRHLLTRLTDQLAAADLEPDDATRDLGRQLAVGRDPGHDNHPLAL